MAEPYNFTGKKQIKDAHAGREAQAKAVLFGFLFAWFCLAGPLGVGLAESLGLS